MPDQRKVPFKSEHFKCSRAAQVKNHNEAKFFEDFMAGESYNLLLSGEIDFIHVSF